MKISRNHLIYTVSIILITFFLAVYQLPYYIYKPGIADELSPIVEVEGGYESEGRMHLVTISSGQATPIQYLSAKILPHHDILPAKEVRPEGITEEEYMHAQLQMMEGSKETSTVVAYEAANKDIQIEYKGVFVVSVRKGMPADGKLQMGDRIMEIDGNQVDDSNGLINYINTKEAGDIVELNILRNDEYLTEVIELDTFKDIDNKVGVGIELVTNREVEVDPPVHFSSGNIGGPSAGLMFALEIYDQLLEEDLTKGYQVIGTGAIDYDGNVSRIGGIDKKVIAADRAKCDIFFAPNESGAVDSNYKEAQQTAEEIGTNMEIVPVDTFQEALTYLENIEPKAN